MHSGHECLKSDVLLTVSANLQAFVIGIRQARRRALKVVNGAD